MPRLWRGYIVRPKGKPIRDHVTMIVYVEARVDHNLKVEVLRVGQLYVHLITISVNLVVLFMPYLRL